MHRRQLGNTDLGVDLRGVEALAFEHRLKDIWRLAADKVWRTIRSQLNVPRHQHAHRRAGAHAQSRSYGHLPIDDASASSCGLLRSGVGDILRKRCVLIFFGVVGDDADNR